MVPNSEAYSGSSDQHRVEFADPLWGGAIRLAIAPYTTDSVARNTAGTFDPVILMRFAYRRDSRLNLFDQAIFQ
jgi:hypothetical protein